MSVSDRGHRGRSGTAAAWEVSPPTGTSPAGRAP